MPNIFLTDDIVLLASCPVGKDQEIYWDHPIGADGRARSNSVSGLGLRVTALGRKAFVHAYVLNGQRYRKVVGSTVLHNVASARAEINNRKQQLEKGTDPEANRINPRRKHFLTVDDVISQYWESHISGLSKESQGAFARFLAGRLRQQPLTVSRRGHNKRKSSSDFGKMFGNRAFATIKPADIDQFQRQFTSSPSSHNSALTRVSSLFNWAIRMQLVDMRNPCTPIRMQKVIRRRRDYSTEQIRRIATYIFYPILEIVPETDHLDGLAKRDMALVKGRVQTGNDQMHVNRRRNGTPYRLPKGTLPSGCVGLARVGPELSI